MNKLILAFLVVLSCLAGSYAASLSESPSSTTTTEQPIPEEAAVATEVTLQEVVEEEIENGENEEESTATPAVEDGEDSSTKNKRTIDAHLGYASLGNRLLAEPYQQYEHAYGRALYSHFPQGRQGGGSPHYKAESQSDAQQQLLRQYYQQMQQQQQYQPSASQQQQYVSSSAPVAATSSVPAATSGQATTYQQPSAEALYTKAAGSYVLPQQQANIFGAVQSPFLQASAAHSSLLGNPYLGLGGANPFLFQNPLALANPLAGLFHQQQPNHLGAGPQLIPVIILRVGADNGPSVNPVQALIYQYLQQQQQQQNYQPALTESSLYANMDAHVQNPVTNVKTIYVQQQQQPQVISSTSSDKYSSAAAYSAKKLAAAGLDGGYKSRKPEQSASSYNTQYKYSGYKEATQ